jgi:hypothetical protein
MAAAPMNHQDLQNATGFQDLTLSTGASGFTGGRDGR